MGGIDREHGKLLETKPKSYYTVAVQGMKEPDDPNGIQPVKERERKIRKEKPDGGWGWLVVFGVALSNMTTQSLISVFGLLFIQRLSDLGITTGGASLMMGVQTTTLNLSGLITGPIINKFSYRTASAVGAILVISGLLLTSHADSLGEFVLTYSLFTGLGLGLLYPSTFVAIDSYFSTKKGRAVGLSVTGTGIGQMVLPLLVEYLLDEYGFNGTLLILAGLASHSLLGATLYQPVEWHMKRVEEVSKENPLEKEKFHLVEEITTGGKENRNISRKKEKDGVFSRIGRAMNMELMKSPSFINLIVGLALVYAANMCFSMLLPFFLESIEYSRRNIALCMSALSGADILGRLILPVFTDVFQMKCKTIFFLGAALSALARSALMFPKQFEYTLILASGCGIVRAALICNFNLAVSEQTTPEKLPSALGLHMIFKGIVMLIFAPLLGIVRDYTKSYALCMHILSIFFLALPFFAWLAEYLFQKKRKQYCHVPSG